MDAANAADRHGRADSARASILGAGGPASGERPMSPVDVARYYLRCELPNIVPASGNADAVDMVGAGLAALPVDGIWRLLEAVSYRFRLNPVFTAVSDEGLDWTEVVLPLDAIIMTGVMPSVDKIVYSSAIARNPVRFVAFLRDYYRQHPHSDPLGLDTFRPRGGPVALDALLVEQVAEGPAMLDGTHRLVELAFAGARWVRVYRGAPNGRPRRPMAGDSAFFQLRDLYARHHDDRDHAAAIMTTVRLLAEDSADGVSAVATYWVDHSRDEAVREAGARLLTAMD